MYDFFLPQGMLKFLRFYLRLLQNYEFLLMLPKFSALKNLNFFFVALIGAFNALVDKEFGGFYVVQHVFEPLHIVYPYVHKRICMSVKNI